MNKYFLPVYHSQLKPWIKWWILKRLGGGESSLKAITLSSGTLTKVDKSKALSIKEYYGNTVQDGTPTPDSPVEVQTISGDNTFTINGENYRLDFGGTQYVSNPIELCKIGSYVDKLKRAEGKNLFNGEVELGSINTSENVTTNNALRSTEYIKVEPSTQYTISNNLNYTTRIYEYNSSKTYVANSSQNTSIYTFTTSATTEYIRFRTIESSTQNNLDVKVMLNIGTTALPYEPYGTNWYIEKNIGKVVLDGNTTGWSGGVVATDVYRFYRPIEGIKARTENTRYIDSFITDRFKLSTNNEYGATYQYHENLYFCVSSNEATTGDSFKTWLSTHNITVYYVLANPTYEVITNENLISQLNVLYEFYVNSSTVTISNNSEIPLEVLLEYYGR